MSQSLLQEYDYGIVGGGIAGMQLALALIGDSHFADASILIIEQDSKDSNDKTLCFWEQGVGQWDDLITHRWSHGQFVNSNGKVNSLNLDTYAYKLLPSLHFYQYAQGKLLNDQRVTWVNAAVTNIEESKNAVAISIDSGQTYTVEHCFDSRVTIDYAEIIKNSAMVYQPFIGLEVEFEKPVFDADSFTMMDYQFRTDDNTAFFYILPLSSTRAFVEYTLFVPDLPPDMGVYIPHIHHYIRDTISSSDYQVNHTEQGMIPMSNYPFHDSNTDRLTKIGTAGSWVRPSTGYAFKYIEYYVGKVINNLKSGRRPSHNLFNKRHQMMDTLLLDLLKVENHLGPWLFDTMYREVPVTLIFKFLDGNTTLIEDIKIMNSFQWMPFFRAIRRQWF